MKTESGKQNVYLRFLHSHSDELEFWLIESDQQKKIGVVGDQPAN